MNNKKQAMKTYNILLEGRHYDKGFLITFEVADRSESSARKLALDEATRMGLDIVGIEEVTSSLPKSDHKGIVKVYGKAYFDLEDS